MAMRQVEMNPASCQLIHQNVPDAKRKCKVTSKVFISRMAEISSQDDTRLKAVKDNLIYLAINFNDSNNRCVPGSCQWDSIKVM